MMKITVAVAVIIVVPRAGIRRVDCASKEDEATLRVMHGLPEAAADQTRADVPGESNRQKRDRLLAANPSASPMAPDHPAWIAPGEHVITLISGRPKQRK
jgi:hypothetical protein